MARAGLGGLAPPASDPVKVSLDLSSLRQLQWPQAALRFGLGGLATVGAGLIAKYFGPVVGGLFLAFPAIFPAGVTLIAQRERDKKRQKGLHGEVRGRRAASLDAAGAVLGALALIVFAVIVYVWLPSHSPALTLLSAALAWVALSVALWWVRKRHGWSRPHPASDDGSRDGN
jgi:hypothetical protein